MADSLKNLNTAALQILYDADNKTTGSETEKLSKTKLKTEVTHALELTSIKVLLESLSVELLGLLGENLELEVKTDKKGNEIKPKRSGNFLRKRLTERLANDGLATYLGNTDTSTLQKIAEHLNVEAKTKVAEAIVAEVEEAGARLYFDSFSEEVLRDVAFEMKLLKDPSATPRRALLVDSILENSEIKKEKKEKKEEVHVSKKKPKLAKGANYQDIFQHYYLEELVAFAKENGLKTTGPKKELINRILAWFDGDKENTLAGQRKAPKRRHQASWSTKKTKKPAKDADAKTDSAPAKTDSAPDADADAGGLDLDNLKSHTVADLKKYCEEEGLTVSGTKKEDYIKAINDYNSAE